MDKFCTHLKEVIKRHGVTASGLSLKSGLDVSAVGKILSGSIRSPRVETLHKLSTALNLYPSELLPLEWQKPDAGLDLNILEQSLIEVLEKGGEASLTPKQKAQLIISAYLQNINKYK